MCYNEPGSETKPNYSRAASVSAGHTVTQLLVEWGRGNPQALEELTPLVYAELRQLAASYLRRERPDHTLQPTALVHEAYLRLVGQEDANWQNRSHFFGVAARLMRQILVDHARRQRAGKRAGRKVSLEDTVTLAQGRSGDLAALDDALTALEKLDARKCKVVELRYFGGLELEEISQALQVSPVTVRRDLKVAESWLYHEMRRGLV
jgi:RNA polymerase sigma-70 factor, ECF subfamily